MCLRAFREEVRPEVALAELAKSGFIDSGAAAMAVINELNHEFGKSAPGSADAAKWLNRLAAMAATGDFGESVRAAFRDNMSAQARQELWLHWDLFYLAVKLGSDGSLELTDEERVALTRLSSSIEEILKKARKPQRGLLAERQGRQCADSAAFSVNTPDARVNVAVDAGGLVTKVASAGPSTLVEPGPHRGY